MIYQDVYAGPANNYGTSTIAKMYVAIHNTSNTASAENEAAYARRRTDNISSHYYVDNDSIIQMLDTKLQAWHAGSTRGNQRAISYEITGVNGWTRKQWLARVDWDKLARQVARDCKTHNIDARLLTVAQMNDGKSTGIVTHDQMRRAWGGTTHTDPGLSFPIDHLLVKVRAQLDGDTMTLTAADLKAVRDAVWRTDNAVPPPAGWPNSNNEGMAGATILNSTWTNTDRIQKILASVIEKLGGDLVDEQAIVDGVLAGIAGKSVADMADALEAALTPEQLNDLALELEERRTPPPSPPVSGV